MVVSMCHYQRRNVSSSVHRQRKLLCLKTISIDPAMKTIAYFRVCHPPGLSRPAGRHPQVRPHAPRVDRYECIEAVGSVVMSHKRRCLGDLMCFLESRDRLVVGELSRPGGSSSQVVVMFDTLNREAIAVIAVKGQMRIGGQPDMQIELMARLLGLFAEAEGDRSSDHIHGRLTQAGSLDRMPARPKGSRAVSPL